MLDNLIFCCNATVPVFLMMVLGYIFKRTGILKKDIASALNSFCFKVPLPVLVYNELATSDIRELWDTGFIVFCFVATAVSIAIGFIVSKMFKDKSVRAEFIQAAYRSSAALLGVGIVMNMYGTAGMVPLMIIGAVPLYNVAAVIILILGQEQGQGINATVIKRTVRSVATNPIIIAIILGIIRAFIPVGILLPKTVSYVSSIATPIGLMALGASFEIDAAISKATPTVVATFFKLIGFAAMWLPLAVIFGYRYDKLVAILIMVASPTTVSSFVMAKSMGHDGTVTAGTVMLTTLLSGFTLTIWLYILRSLGLI